MTYSLGITGARADNPAQIENLTISDANARDGSLALAMRQGAPVLCKGPDGVERYYEIDAERSTPAIPVLIAVGP